MGRKGVTEIQPTHGRLLLLWLWRVHGPGGSWVVLVDGNRLGLTRVWRRLGLLGVGQGRLRGILPIYIHMCGVKK